MLENDKVLQDEVDDTEELETEDIEDIDDEKVTYECWLKINEAVCPVCGKTFCTPYGRKQWVYRENRSERGKCVCSWKCARASEKNKDVDILAETELLIEKELYEKSEKTVERILSKRKCVSGFSEFVSDSIIEFIRENLIESQTDLAEEFGVKISTARAWAYGSVRPTKKSIKRLIRSGVIKENELKKFLKNYNEKVEWLYYD